MKKLVLLLASLATVSFAFMTENNPGLMISPGNKIVTKEVVCDDGTMGFTVVITSSYVKNNVVYFSCEDPEMKGKYKQTENSGTEPAGAENLIIGDLEFFSREFDSGVGLDYDQAVAFCENLGARLPTAEEMEASFNINSTDLINAHNKENADDSLEYWTSTSTGTETTSYKFNNDNYESNTSLTSSARFNVKCVKDN